MIIEITAIVGVLFLAGPDGIRTSVESIIFQDMATCKAANKEAEDALTPNGWQVRTVCIDTGIKIKMNVKGKAS